MYQPLNKTFLEKILFNPSNKPMKLDTIISFVSFPGPLLMVCL